MANNPLSKSRISSDIQGDRRSGLGLRIRLYPQRKPVRFDSGYASGSQISRRTSEFPRWWPVSITRWQAAQYSEGGFRAGLPVQIDLSETR